ncbi:alpha/beta hydrolase [Streptomyces sp. NPDC056785]|uniref:alpha/beta hydrolase n=1 Tax=Streptomyces sp. NPDC056785 TaxID=3345944 RepID=UPI0036764F31
MPSVHHRWTYVGARATALALLTAGLPSAAVAADAPDLSRFYHQKITWGACVGDGMPADLQCGKVTVPLDYAHPQSGTLDVAMARYRATGPSRGSVLLNFGGPGGAGVPELAQDGGKDFMDLTNGYDVVTFDPRGVGRSSPVSCGNGAGTTGAVGDGGDAQSMLKALRKVASECTAHSGPVLTHMGTVDASRDMDVMRQALGDKKLNYLGFSYGTRLGAVYAAQFPKKTGRMVLDGVDTLTESMAEQGLVGAEGQQTALDDFLTWCTEDVSCPFGEDSREAREDVVRLVASLDRDPVPTSLGQMFSGQDLAAAVGQALYSRRMWPALERALASLVQDRDTQGLAQLSGGGASLPASRTTPGSGATGAPHAGLANPGDIPVDNLPAAFMAINCADDPDRPSAQQAAKDLDKLRAAYDEASPVFGRYRLTQVLLCHGRPKGTDYIRDDVRNVRTPKMLLVGTRGDPATPYRWTEETAARLGSAAVVLDNRSEGHTGYASSKCVHQKVDNFLLYGALPKNGSSCGPESGRDEP